jgi:FixJ family two-component response regulator
MHQVTQIKQMVLVLDDDPVVRSSLNALLTARGYGFLSFATADELFESGQPTEPACLLLDHHLGLGLDGAQVYQKMRENGWELPTIFLTAHWNVQSVVTAIRSGVDGFVVKPFDPEELIKAVDHAMKQAFDQQWSRSEILETRERMATLTPREREVVSLVTGGLLNKEIADQLGLALVTVKVHRGRAMKKLGAGNSAELVKIMLLAG